MTVRPIIFSAPMVKALLAGRKTQTRRVLGPNYIRLFDGHKVGMPAKDLLAAALTEVIDMRQLAGTSTWVWSGRAFDYQAPAERTWWQGEITPTKGDVLYVRETWKPHSIYADRRPRDIPQSKVFYRADDAYAPSNTPWVPPIHMPRWASRLTLVVTDVRVERLQSISNDDALAEGALECTHLPGIGAMTCDQARVAFAILWDSIHGNDACEQNPWVVALTFSVHNQNVDAYLKAAA